MTDESEPANDDAEVTESTDAEEPTDGLEPGQFVRVDFTARTVENGQLVDTTDEEVAQAEGVDEEDRSFEPRVVILGEGHLFPTVESDIEGKEVGDTGSVTVPATEAFGEHDPDEVRTVSVDRIPEDDRYPGAHVDIDGEHGHVETIIGGRARVDFNHPLAGADIEYNYEIVDVVEDRLERAEGLVDAYIGVSPEMSIDTVEVEEEQPVETEDDEDDEEPEFEMVTVEKETLYIESTPQLTMNQQWMFQKQQVADELIDRIGVDRVVVREVLEKSPASPMGGMGAGMGDVDLEEAIEDAEVDVDADELADELDVE